MARKSNTISILRIDLQEIARLRVQKSSKGVEVLSYDITRGPWKTEDGSLEKALNDFSARHHLDDDAIFTVISRFDVTVRILTLPTQSPEEAASMVRLSAEEFVPYSADELIIDQCLLQKLPNGESKVLAALAHQDIVNNHLALLRSANLDPERIFLSTACLASAVRASLESTEEPIAVIDLASGGLEVIVLAAGQLQYGRAIATVQDWSKADDSASDALHELSLEARGSLAAYRRESEDAVPVSTVYLCSEFARTQFWSESLEQETGKECRPAGFLTTLMTRGKDQISTLPAVLLGAALAAQDRAAVSINLLPQTLKQVRALEGTKRRFLFAAGLVAIVLLAYGLLYAQAVHQRQSYIHNLSREVAKIEPNARGVAEKQEQLNILRKQIQRKGSAIESMDAAFEAAPMGRMTITRFSYDRSDGINIFGHAMSVDDVHGYAESLRALAKNGFDMLANARSVYWNKAEERQTPIFAYLINIPFAVTENADELPAENR